MLNMLNKGIVSIAVKNPYYGRMVYNLCASIKAWDKDMPFAVIADQRGLSHLGSHQIDIFDQVIPLDAVQDEGVGVKLLINKLSPFEETIFLDADTVWVPGADPAALFGLIPADVYFTAITEGMHDYGTGISDLSKRYTFWADINDICEKYMCKTERVYQWRSEVMYIKKGEQADKLFELAKDIFCDPKVDYLKFASGVPDELAINLACMILGVEPHRFRWMPGYWFGLHGMRVPSTRDLVDNGFFIISCGGSHTPYSLQKNYGRIMRVAMNKLNRQHIFGLLPKSEFLRDRKF